MRADDVTDFNSFLAFVGWLAADRADEVEKEARSPSNPWGPGANGWENTTIESFLEAAVRWAVDWNKKTGVEPEPTWREFARILYMGKIYE